MTYSDIIDKVSKELDLPKSLVDKVYKNYWLYIRESILSLPLKDNLNAEDFSKLRTNFNVPALGKLTCTFDRMSNIKRKYNYIKNKLEKDDLS